MIFSTNFFLFQLLTSKHVSILTQDPSLHQNILDPLKQIKDNRNFFIHEAWEKTDLVDIQRKYFRYFENLVQMVALIRPSGPVPLTEVTQELTAIENHLNDVINDTQRDAIDEMVKEHRTHLVQMFNQNQLKKRLEEYQIPRFLKGDQEVSFDDIPKYLDNSGKLILTGHSGHGKTMLSW